MILNMYRWFKSGIILFMGPTRPLVKQQYEECHKCTGIPQTEIAVLTGDAKKERNDLWNTKRVFFCTPQCVDKDIAANLVPLNRIVLVVVDEAHHAQGNYAYVNVVSAIHKQNPNFQVLALSASPGNDVRSIQSVITNLHISEMIVRDDADPSVVPYVHGKVEDVIAVDPDPAVQPLRAAWNQLLMPYAGIIKNSALNMSQCPIDKWTEAMFMHAQQFEVKTWPQQDNNVIGALYVGVQIARAREMLDIYGVRVFNATLQNILQSPNSALKTAMQRMGTAGDKMRQLVNDNLGKISPKMTALIKSVTQTLTESPNARIMIFSNYRESVSEIVEALKSVPGAKAAGFTGKGAASASGMT